MKEMGLGMNYFLEYSSSAYFVGSMVTHKTTYMNKKAQTMFGMTVETCDFTQIFQRKEVHMGDMIEESLKVEKSCLIYDMLVTCGDGRKVLVDLQLGYFNEENTEIYLEMVPKSESIEQLTLHQVNHSPRAEAVINMDDCLTLHFGNPNFYRLFEGSHIGDFKKYQQQIKETFVTLRQDEFVENILEGLTKSETYYTEVEVITLSGEKRWLALDLQKRVFENQQEKILCYAYNIDEKMKHIEEISLLNQYLSVIQESTVDILYRIDVEENVMYHYSDFIKVGRGEKAVPRCVDLFLSDDTVHPEDKENYLKNFHDFYEKDIQPHLLVRFSFGGMPYQWYQITAKKIYDSEGVLKEVFGALVNVHKEQTMQAEVSAFHAYFEALQSISRESFYSVDVKNKVLTQKGKVAEELGFFEDVHDFPESVLHKVHPEDMETYRDFTEASMQGVAGSVQVRVKTASDDYQWYEILCNIVRDKQGNVVEVVGKMNNIQNQRNALDENSILNQYFRAVQSLSGESLYTVNIRTRELKCYGIAAEELGLPTVVEGCPQTVYYLIHPSHLSGFETFINRSLSGENSKNTSLRLELKNTDGSYQWYELLSMIIYDENGEPIEILGKIKNIQSEHSIQSQYSILHQYFSAMQELTSDKLFHIDIETKMFYHNDVNTERYGVPLEIPNFMETMIEKKIVHPDTVEDFRKSIQALLQGDKMDYKVLALVGKDTYEWVRFQGRLIRNAKGESVEIFGKMENIQKQMDLEERGTYDPLTMVLNKGSFAEEVKKVMREDEKGSHHALVIIDIDDFKEVNDAYGHQFGDFVLENFAQRIKNCIRETDLMGRLGGDEFLVFLKGVFDKEMALSRAETMLDRLKSAFGNGEFSHKLGASIGIAIIPDDEMTYEILYRNAGKAVYESKKIGKNVATLYSSDFESEGDIDR